MNIPDKIRIAGHTVDVKLVPEKDLPGLCGDFQTKHNLIRICSEGAKSNIEQTLLHEIVEYIDGIMQLGMEHRQIQALTEVLYQVFKDNELL